MAQKTILITGASDGIGAAAAKILTDQGHRVLITGRSPEKTASVAWSLGVEHFVADFSRFDDVRSLAAWVTTRTDALDALGNNAGGLFGARTLTADGHEKTLQVNHLAPFLLTHLLLEPLQAGAGVVVTTSSSASHVFGRIDMDDLGHEKDYNPQRAYGDSKLANILFTHGLHDRYAGSGISAVAFHPGVVASNFASDTTSWVRHVYRSPVRHLMMTSSARAGSHLAHFLGGTPGRTWMPDTYYEKRSIPAKAAFQAADRSLVDQLWDASARLVAVPA